jgi:catechol 2,3-dioxygenase-like lactoylglutathione lyase family enzyme
MPASVEAASMTPVEPLGISVYPALGHSPQSITRGLYSCRKGRPMTLTSPKPFHHIGIGVPDIEAAIAWYADVMGYRVFTGPVLLELENDGTGQLRDVLGPKFRKLKIAHLSTGGGAGLELFEPIDPPFERRQEDVEFWKSGTFHFCVMDPDIDGLVARIVATGGRQLSKIWEDRPSSNMRMVYCQDPFGTLIEIHTHPYEIVQGWR